MTGGLLQIVAYGPQDMYLTHNPQITFFKTVYRRHTNFSIQQFKLGLESALFGYHSHYEIHRLGDLVGDVYLVINLPSFTPSGGKFAWTKRLGHAIIKNIQIEIGGAIIDKQTGVWLDIWYELARNPYNEKGYLSNIGDVPIMTTLDENTKPEYMLYIPLKFWFNTIIGLSLPLISIQYHRILFTILFENIENLVITDTSFDRDSLSRIKISDASFLIDFIFLDETERKLFATLSHEYLMEQLQYTDDINIYDTNIREKINFNYPVKELIWCFRNGYFMSNKKFLCYNNLPDWSSAFQYATINIIQNSILLLTAPTYGVDSYGNTILLSPGITPQVPGSWYEISPNSSGETPNGKINIINNSADNSLFFNTSSIISNNTNLTDKLYCTITVTVDNTIILSDISQELNIMDVSIPTDIMTDTRIGNNDIIINIPSNYGLYLDGSSNPVINGLLEFNNEERFKKRSGNFFNYLQPEMHHTNTPKDGINLYSFAIKPEMHQPSGTANLSKIENVFLQLEIDPGIINIDTILYIFAKSYNILRISNGLAALAYT
jgi:hypothetical protein